MSTTSQDFFISPELVARALAHLAEQCHDELDRLARQPHQGAPDIKDETRFYLRQYRAFIKAAYHWGRGVRPVPMPEGGWLIPSGTRANLIHEIKRHGGVWVCGPSCEAREQFHWHTALACGIEHALELADGEDDGDAEPADAYEAYEPTPEYDDEPWCPGAPSVLGRRIAAESMRRMNELFAA